MSHILRETAFGRLTRVLTRNKFFQYPEEKQNFVLPVHYQLSGGSDEKGDDSIASRDFATELGTPLAQVQTARDDESIKSHSAEQALELSRAKSIPIVPQKTLDGVILVDWYTTDDQDNPQNWPRAWKIWIIVVMCAYTFAMYCSASIIVPSTAGMMENFDISEEAALIPFAVFVIGYGIGPVFLGPLSEIPVVGRNAVYVVTFALFFALSFPTAVVQNYAGLCVLRFLTGIFSSPAVTIVGATFSDLYTLLYVPYQLGWWVWSAWAGPAVGFLLAGFAVSAKDWHWALWEIVWMSGPIALLLFFLSPETSAANILLRRAQRLRRLTGNDNLRSQSEIDQSRLSASRILSNALVKPIEIMIKDPAILFVNTYTALFYGIYYTFFECFPLVFQAMHGFNLGETGLAFLSCQVGATVGLMLYFSYLHWYMIPDNLRNGLREQEHRLVPAMIGSWLLPVGLFLFAWTARPDIHWIVPLIGVVIFVTGFYLVMQGLFVYLPLSYPQYAASLFSGNDVCRSAFAAGAIAFARPMFLRLGVARGVTLLGGLTGMGIIGMICLYIYGKRLRKMSTFAQG